MKNNVYSRCEVCGEPIVVGQSFLNYENHDFDTTECLKYYVKKRTVVINAQPVGDDNAR